MRLNPPIPPAPVKDDKGEALVPRFGFYGCFWSTAERVREIERFFRRDVESKNSFGKS